MKKTKQLEMQNLLNRYSEIKDELLDYTQSLHDGMYYDIDGYWDSYYMDDFDDLPTLRTQVEAFELILKGYKSINYVFC